MHLTEFVSQYHTQSYAGRQKLVNLRFFEGRQPVLSFFPEKNGNDSRDNYSVKIWENTRRVYAKLFVSELLVKVVFRAN